MKKKPTELKTKVNAGKQRGPLKSTVGVDIGKKEKKTMRDHDVPPCGTTCWMKNERKPRLQEKKTIAEMKFLEKSGGDSTVKQNAQTG